MQVRCHPIGVTVVVAFVVLLGLGVLALSAPASAKAAATYKSCGGKRIQHDIYSISARAMSCKRARQWTERYIRRHVEPKGWKCSSGGCEDRNSNAAFIWFRPFDRESVLALRKSRDCGTINVPNDPRDAQVLAHNVRCKQARRAAKYAVGSGPKPKGWICSASLGRCYKGGFDSNRYIKVKWE